MFYTSPEQKQTTEALIDTLKARGYAVVTDARPADRFWKAEAYHQDYYKKNSFRYNFYVTGCGRYARLDSLWGELREKYNPKH